MTVLTDEVSPSKPEAAKKVEMQDLLAKFNPLYAVPFVFGAGAAIQQSMMVAVSSQLAGSMEKKDCKSCPWFGSLVNMIGGLIISLILFSSPVLRLYSKPNAPDRPKFRWWMPFGGVLLTLVVICVTLGFGAAGSMLTAVQFNVANIGVSLIFDHFGFMSFPKRKITVPQIVAVLLFLASAICATLLSGKDFHEADGTIILPFVAGVLFAFFLAFNVSSSMALPFPQQPSLMNYCVACPLTLIIWGSIYGSQADEVYTAVTEWWTLFPGVIEMFMIMCGFYLVPILGITIYQQFFITGQLVMGTIVDQFGLFGAQVFKGTAGRYVGVALSIVAVIISVFFAPKVHEDSADTAKDDVEGQDEGGEKIDSVREEVGNAA